MLILIDQHHHHQARGSREQGARAFPERLHQVFETEAEISNGDQHESEENAQKSFQKDWEEAKR